MNYQDAMQMFRDELLDNKDVLMLSDYYSRTKEDHLLKMLISHTFKVKRYRDKSIEVSINRLFRYRISIKCKAKCFKL